MTLKKILSGITVCIAAFAAVNLVCAAYSLDAKWINRDYGATSGIYQPDSFIVTADEGLGFVRTDSRGYVNPHECQEQDFILCFGNSHTNAVQVMPQERYAAILENLLEENGYGRNRVYCVAQGGSTLADLVGGFNALVGEFPGADAVVLQINNIGVLPILNTARDQREYRPEADVSALLENEPSSSRFMGFIKRYMPAAAYIANYQIKNIKTFDRDAFLQAGTVISGPAAVRAVNSVHRFRKQIEKALDSDLKLIRSEFDGTIIVLFHPYISISEAGEMELNTSPEELELLENACENNGIGLCYVGDDFLREYSETHTVPYGFFNTAPGKGHLNRTGHRILAEALYRKLKEEGL